ncbi:MAG: hypothetical protein AAB895_03380 [Patescibacteria group bacterium]
MKKELRVLFVAMPDIGHVCDDFKKADVILETANSLQLTLDKLREGDYHLIVTNAVVEGGSSSEIKDFLDEEEKDIPIVGVSTDLVPRKMMIADGFIRAVRFEEAPATIIAQLEQLSK